MINLKDSNSRAMLRKSRDDDHEQVMQVEAKATPNLRYLSRVFDVFVSDQAGEFSVVEVDNKIVACGKCTIMPDGSAWVETLRVIPACQGLGIGKRLFERFVDLARRKGVTTLRMYTNVGNAVSQGLAERFDLQLAATYRGAWLPCRAEKARTPNNGFQPVTDPEKATTLLMPYREKWTGFLVMNRTFYAITPALCAELAHNGQIYQEPTSGSVIAMGARFMPEQALHIGVWGGDVAACLKFAMQEGIERGTGRLSCFFPPSAQNLQRTLLQHGFQLESSDLIVMEGQV